MATLESVNQWNAALYDEKLSFVSNYGKGVVRLLAPQRGEHILDIGCGTGDLTAEISESGAIVTGLDQSEAMLEKARDKYPEITFIQDNVLTFTGEASYHAIFSNAALHWIRQPEQAARSVYDALVPGGRFVAEFGGKDNVTAIIAGILQVLKENYGIDARDRIPWYFPSIGTYSQLLERLGFRVVYAHHYDRPTILADGEEGLSHWLESFADDFFPEFSESERRTIYEQVKNACRSQMFSDGNWVADYKRLQVIAVKAT